MLRSFFFFNLNNAPSLKETHKKWAQMQSLYFVHSNLIVPHNSIIRGTVERFLFYSSDRNATWPRSKRGK